MASWVGWGVATTVSLILAGVIWANGMLVGEKTVLYQELLSCRASHTDTLKQLGRYEGRKGKR